MPPYSPPRDIYVLIDDREISLPFAVREAMDWLPVGRDRMIFISGAPADFPDWPVVFEALRRGLGASSDVRATPGCLFRSTKSAETNFEDRPELDVAEESAAMWMAALALEFTWPGGIFVQGCDEFIELGDGYMRFVSPSAARLQMAVALAAELKLQARETFPWN